MNIRVRDGGRRVNGKPVKRYQAVWIEDGRRHTETFDTRELAQDKLDGVKTLLSQGKSPASLRELAEKRSAWSLRNGWRAVTISNPRPALNTPICWPARRERTATTTG